MFQQIQNPSTFEPLIENIFHVEDTTAQRTLAEQDCTAPSSDQPSQVAFQFKDMEAQASAFAPLEFQFAEATD